MSASLGDQLANWALQLQPAAVDEALADRALIDTVAVAIAGRGEPVVGFARPTSEGALWATASHALDFDDLHPDSTTHISAVCVPSALAVGGDSRAYLAGAGVMARLGIGLGWEHYAAGWHATTTTGALGAAVAAAVGLGLDAAGIATAMALAVPAAGGVQRAFGTDSKALQVGFAVDAGVRAAHLAAAGATANVRAIDAWFTLLGGDIHRVFVDSDAVPGGLAMKFYPCCYAMQRPIDAISEAVAGVPASRIRSITITTPASTVTPLIHHRPRTGQQSKFSLEYAAATAVIDEHQGFDSFTDSAVQRHEATELMARTIVQLTPDGEGLLSGEFSAVIDTDTGLVHARQKYPPGSPSRPLTAHQLAQKVDDCTRGAVQPRDIAWSTASSVLRSVLA